MASIIEAFEEFDNDLVKHIDNKIETILLLEDVEKGSLKAKLINILKGIPDEAIEEFEWKKLVGHYLLKAKYIILDRLEGKVILTDAEEIEAIEMEISKIASETGVDKIPTYVPTNKKILIKNISNINESIKDLNEKDQAYVKSDLGDAKFNLTLSIDSENLEELLTNESIKSNTKMILKVKKPDYLADSQWTFKHGSKTINAKITDLEWLANFHNRKIDVRPQDSLVCEVEINAKYDHNYELIGSTHEIVKVIRLIQDQKTIKLIWT